jgi:putative ABC transport system ATP-binding protein
MLLQCQNISKSFEICDEKITPLKSISFSADSGETVVIAGKSGAGKSVLLSLICGLDRPCSGEIVYRGESASGFSMSRWNRLRRSDISIVFQNCNLISSWTVLENVEAALVHESLSGKTRLERAKRILSRLGLGNRLQHLPHQLSLGEQQRVAVARTLIRNPRLILADEPTGEVDLETAREIIALLTRPVEENNAALLVATHGHFPLNRADRVYVLEDGRLRSGSPAVKI